MSLELTCDMTHDCKDPVTMLDNKGFAYCTAHGLHRRTYIPCRKLRRHELNRMKRGEQVRHY